MNDLEKYIEIENMNPVDVSGCFTVDDYVKRLPHFTIRAAHATLALAVERGTLIKLKAYHQGKKRNFYRLAVNPTLDKQADKGNP